MRKIVLIAGCALLCTLSRAQVSMALHVPAAGVLLKSQLWGAGFTNTNAGLPCVLSLVLTDAQTNQPVLNATTKEFTLPAGASVFGGADFSPIQYNYPSAVMTDRSPDGFLNVGQYHACYTLSAVSGEGTLLQQDCIDITVEPVSPPMLAMPADQDTLLTNMPQFNWLPPAPLNIFGSLGYDFLLVEVQPGQTAAQAVQQNVPVYSAGNLADIFLGYPASYKGLDTGRLYAWQVIARDNGRFAAQSDIWTFSISPQVLSKAPLRDGKPYTQLKKEQGAPLAFFDRVIKIAYTNAAGDSLVAYTVTSLEDGNAGEIVKSGGMKLGKGENFIDIPVTANDKLADDKIYLFEFTNSANEKWSVKFIYHEPAGN